MIKRILIFSLILVFVFSVLVFPVGAEILDYNDYVSDIVVDGENDIVTVTLPVSSSRIAVFNQHTGIWESNVEGVSSSTVSMNNHTEYSVRFVPDYLNQIGVDNIPDGTQILIKIGIDASNPNNTFAHPQMADVLYYYLADGSVVSQVMSEGLTVSLPELATLGLSYTLSYPAENTKAFSFSMDLQNFKFSQYGTDYPLFSDNVTFTVYSYSLTMSISSLYRQQQISGKTNKLLSAVEDQLEENGQKLDEIINGSVDPTPPPESDKVDDLEDLEGELRDEAQAGLDEGLAMQQSALEVFAQYASAFAVVGLIFGFFADIPFFKFLLYISVSVGLFSVLLNLGFDIGRARSRSTNAKSGKSGGS